MNKIVVNYPRISGNQIEVTYKIEGKWKEAFIEDSNFWVEYSCDISQLPASIAIIPLLVNILPISWLYDAEIIVPCCDRVFYDSVKNFKEGYAQMYPMLEFKGRLTVDSIEENYLKNSNRCATFYSGGVDATETLIRHIEKKPILLSIWGFNITLKDLDGWNNVLLQLDEIKKEYALDNITIKSNFRSFINIHILDELVKNTGLLWFYGFQNGIGIIGLAAPIAYTNDISTLFIASTNTDEKCSSVPQIDENVRFSDTMVIHDAAGTSRQEKIRTIIKDSKENSRKVLLNVCWTKNKPRGVINCCKCIKCLLTMIAIYAEGENPRDYGFEYDEEEWIKSNKKLSYGLSSHFNKGWMSATLDAIHENFEYEEVRDDLKWFYKMSQNDLGKVDISDCLIKVIKENGYENKVLVWSACVKTDRIVEELEKYGIKICGYIDQKASELDNYNGYKVYDKKKLVNDKYFVYVGMDTPYYEVLEWLEKNNYKEYRDYFYPNS